jgi:threonine synthase
MDVSEPSNWARVEALFERQGWPLSALSARSVSDQDTATALRSLRSLGYRSEPHGAVAWRALQAELDGEELGMFLCTAHPAKFKELVEELLAEPVTVPEALAQYATRPLLSVTIPATLSALRAQLGVGSMGTRDA